MTNISPRKIIKDGLISPVKEFISDSRSAGIVLIICTVVSLVISNSSWSESYLHFWERHLFVPAPDLRLPDTLLHLVNDGLMAIFFFLVGLEIKRELLVGELASFKKSVLPIIAALGGMVVPAFIYYLWCGGTPFSKGWGIPMATDIAFSLGILSLLGKRAPLSLRIFLTALAIIDDLGGILTIAIFYAREIDWFYLWLSLGLLFVLGFMNVMRLKRYYYYLFLGLFLWYFIFNSGVHATIAGVLLAFTIPLHKIEELEHALHDPVSFIVMPIFALANTAILMPTSFDTVFSSVVHHGILMGLVVGKPAGIFLFSYLAVKMGIGSMPNGVSWKQFLGMGMIAGVGFTISIFISTLAFDDPDIQVVAKVAIMSASLLVGLLGFLYLLFLGKRKKKTKMTGRMAQNS